MPTHRGRAWWPTPERTAYVRALVQRTKTGSREEREEEWHRLMAERAEAFRNRIAEFEAKKKAKEESAAFDKAKKRTKKRDRLAAQKVRARSKEERRIVREKQNEKRKAERRVQLKGAYELLKARRALIRLLKKRVRSMRRAALFETHRRIMQERIAQAAPRKAERLVAVVAERHVLLVKKPKKQKPAQSAGSMVQIYLGVLEKVSKTPKWAAANPVAKIKLLAAQVEKPTFVVVSFLYQHQELLNLAQETDLLAHICAGRH